MAIMHLVLSIFVQYSSNKEPDGRYKFEINAQAIMNDFRCSFFVYIRSPMSVYAVNGMNGLNYVVDKDII